MDPLSLVGSAVANGRLPEKVLSRVQAKLPILRDAVNNVEAASGLDYPPFYVNPVFTLAEGVDGIAMFYSRTIPMDSGNRVAIMVEFSIPLVLYSTKATVQAVAAHEFLHYVELVDRFTKMNVSSERFASQTFEAPYQDLGMLAEPQLILREKKLLRLLNSKFKPNLRDRSLDDRAWRTWVQKNLPTQRVRLDENTVRLSVASILNTKYDENVVQRLKMIGHQSSRPAS